MAATAHITVCVCTYRRAELLKKLLSALAIQQTGNAFSYSVVVADNDKNESGRAVVEQFAAQSSLGVVYCVEPDQNIAKVRNKALQNAGGDFIAFMDDDEFPPENWLRQMLQACEQYKAAGVLAPVEPHFEQPPPEWITKGRFCNRPRHPTGFVMPPSECRTGNVLFRRGIIAGHAGPFNASFGMDSEDIDFFRRMMAAGHTFIWCDEAVVWEVVPPNRWERRFMLKRALMRGKTSLIHPKGRIQAIGKSLVAVPLYLLALPFLAVAGHHFFMKYLIKLCDHFGRLLAAVRLNPIRRRPL